jgi:hypothetical protein
MKPRARKTGLVVRELEGELLVYDLQAHRAHCLNSSAAIVFRGSDGRTTLGELAARLRRELGVRADERWVRLAIGRLSKAGLLEEGPTPLKKAGRTTRRELMRRAGQVAGLALLLPAVTSVVAPTPAEAAATCVTNCSGQGLGTPCRNSNPADCGLVCVCNGAGGCVLASDGVTACP